MIPRRCERCRRAVWVWPWQTPVCRGSHSAACFAIAEAVAVEEGRVEEPGPLWASRPPPDITSCSRCRGRKRVQTRMDWENGPQWDTCPRCEGTGVDPSWHPVV